MIHKISDTHNLIIHHISDTHGQHIFGMDIPIGTDILIHSGDGTNHRDLILNSPEWDSFIKWFGNLPIPIKIFVPGNHDASCYFDEKRCRKVCSDVGVEYLNKDTFSVYGLNFYGEPITPVYGNWHFTTTRSKIAKHWDIIPENTDVLITHGPRKGVLDLSYHGRDLAFCGDSALGKRMDKLDIKLHCFGHIHDSHEINNVGVLERDGVFYSNASAVKDGKINSGIHFHGNTFKL